MISRGNGPHQLTLASVSGEGGADGREDAESQSEAAITPKSPGSALTNATSAGALPSPRLGFKGDDSSSTSSSTVASPRVTGDAAVEDLFAAFLQREWMAGLKEQLVLFRVSE